MKIYIPLSLLFFIIVSMSGCQAPDIPDMTPTPPKDTIPYPLDMVWESYHMEDTMFVISTGVTIAYKDKYVIYNGSRQDNDLYYVIVYDKKTGERLKAFKTGFNILSEMAIVDRYLVVPSLDGVFIYDLEALRLVKRIEGQFSSPILTKFDESIYLTREYGNIPFIDSSAILRLDIPSFRMEKVLSATREQDGGWASLNNISFEIRADGDTVFYGAAAVNPKNIYCYNKTQRVYEWKTIVPEPNDFYWSHPLYDSIHVYVTNSWGLEAYDKQTGERVWRVELHDGQGGFRGLEPLLIDGLVYVKEGNYNLYCIRGLDGKMIWRNDESGTAPSNYLAHYKDMIYYVGRGNVFYVVDMKTGEMLLKIKGPYHYSSKYVFSNKWARFENNPPLIDAENGVMFMQDRLRMFCFKIWEP